MTARLCTTTEDFAAWDRYVLTHGGAHYLQTYGWLRSYEPLGFTPHVIVHDMDRRILGGVGFLTASVPLIPWRIAIIPHGPLPANPDHPSWLPVMERLDQVCRERRAIYAQIYPHELSEKSELMGRLQELGFTGRSLFTSHKFSTTPVTIDLAGRSGSEILMSCRPRTRQYIRKALTGAFEVRTDVDTDIFEAFYRLLIENGRLMGYRPRPYASLRRAWDWMAPRGMARLVQAWDGSELVGAVLLLFAGRTAYYVAGAFRREYGEHRPAEFLHWHGIQQAIVEGMTTYDFVNTVSPGVEQFKRGFRPQQHAWHDPQTKLYRPLIANVVGTAERMGRGVVRTLVRYRARLMPSSEVAR